VLVKCGIAERGMQNVNAESKTVKNECGMVSKMWNAQNVDRLSTE